MKHSAHTIRANLSQILAGCCSGTGCLALLGAVLLLLAGCGGGSAQKQKNQAFFTSGSREADQRASQRMAQSEQLAGSGEGTGERETKEDKSSGQGGSSGPETVQAEGKRPLFDRLGGQAGLTALVDDFSVRVMQDPRVNWARKDVKSGGLLHSGDTVLWQETPENVASLKKHMVQFLALATGGPAHYEGKEMKSAHENMRIGNSEFDAAMGDLKASLDKLRIANKEQKELLAIVESTRPQIVTER
jgi:hemoglobin